MIRYNREKIFSLISSNFGKLNSEQKEGLDFLLTKLENSRRIDTEPKRAYTLATIYWETAHTFQPITEMGTMDYLRSRAYWPYIGRGYVQLTWQKNYKLFGDYLNIDLVKFPEKAGDKETAWKILEIGMTDKFGIKDPDFTAYTLEDFFHDGLHNYKQARKIINPRDFKSYDLIANVAVLIVSILILCKEQEKGSLILAHLSNIEAKPVDEIPTPEIKEKIKKEGFFDWLKKIISWRK